MTRQRGTLRRLWGGAALGLAAAFSALALLAPTALADPQSDAAGAIDAAWSAAGGEQSQLGARDGEVYAAGAGFGQNFTGGAIFFTPETGARVMYGEILAKYRALGGPAESDLGFPTIDEGPGRISPESRNSIFSAPDQPVIFWTPQSGAWVVRGAINAAWDALGGSSGTLGVPTADQTRDGAVVSQAFSGGRISFDTATRQFTTEPADLAQQLGNVTIPGEVPPPPPPPPAAPPTEAAPTAPAAPPAVTPTSPAAPQADEAGGFRWHNWWLWWIVPLAVLLLGSLVAWLVSRRRRAATVPPRTPTPALTEPSAFDVPDEGPRWVPPTRDHEEDHWLSDLPSRRSDPDAPLFGSRPQFDDLHGETPVAEAGDEEFVDIEPTAAIRDLGSATPEFELFTHRGAHAAAEDPDAVDTAPTPVQPPSWEGELTATGRHAALDFDEPEFDATDFRRDEYEDYREPSARESVAEVIEPDVRYADETDDDDEAAPTIRYADEPDDDLPPAVVATDEDDWADEPYRDEGRGESDFAADSVGMPPALHLPLDDPHLAPEGYPVKGRMSTGTYHTPDSAGYDDVVAEIWFADAAHAEANGFVSGD
jgi:LGFP repeat